MLNTIKNLVVITMLLGVGYGTHVVLNRPITSDSPQTDGTGLWPSPDVDLGQAQTLRPDVSLGPTGSSAPPTIQPLDQMETSDALDSPPPPIGSFPRTAELPATDHTEPIDSQVATSTPAAPTDLGTLSELSEDTNDVESVATQVQPTEKNRLDASHPPETHPGDGATDASEQELAALAQSVQQQLDNGELAAALTALSQWYTSPTAREDRKAQLLPLLDQLAGSVIYSRRHLLEPSYTVQEHETLEQIAQRYHIPMNLLAKINGIAAPYDLFPGETLKVMRGPFRAETSLSRRELTLFLDTDYAGRFSVRLGSDVSIDDGVLEVAEKLEQPTYTDSENGQEIPPDSPDNPYGRHWIGLRQLSSLSPSDALGIHGTGEGCNPDDSRGCIGLEARDAEDLYSILSIGSTVRIVR